MEIGLYPFDEVAPNKKKKNNKNNKMSSNMRSVSDQKS